MANRYWVGGTGTWSNSSTTNWSTSSGGASGASAPGTGDAAIFDANSNTGTNDFTVTLASGPSGPSCLTLNTTGIDPTNAMTVAGTGNLTVAGTVFTLTNKVSWTHTGTITFSPPASSTLNITTAGVSLACAIDFNGAGSSTYNFVDAFTTTKGITLSSGTLTSTGSNKTITCLTLNVGNNTINTGTSSTFNITGNAATVYNDSGTGVFTTKPTFNFTYSGSTGTRTISSKNAAIVNVTAGSDTIAYSSNDNWGTTNFTGFSGTFQTGSNALTISGNLTTPAGMSFSGSGTLSFDTTSTITTNGITYGTPITVDTAGITVTLNGNLSVTSFTLSRGTFNAVTYNVTLTSLLCTGTNTRTLALGSGTWTSSGSGAGAWNCGVVATNLTVTGTGKISMNNAASKTFQGGGLTWPVLENSGAGTLVITGANTFTTIQNSVQPTTFQFPASTTQTVTNFLVSGTSGNLVTIQSSSAGTAATLSKSSGIVSSDYLSIRDSTATGGATWYAGANSTNVSGNTGWIFTAPPTTFGNFFLMFGA